MVAAALAEGAKVIKMLCDARKWPPAPALTEKSKRKGAALVDGSLVSPSEHGGRRQTKRTDTIAESEREV